MVDGVQSIHHTQIWSLDGEHHVLSTHVVVDENSTKEEVTQIKCEINELTRQLGFEHITVEIEYEYEECRIKKRNHQMIDNEQLKFRCSYEQ